MRCVEKAKTILVQSNTDVPRPPYVPDGWNPWGRPYGPTARDVAGIAEMKRR